MLTRDCLCASSIAPRSLAHSTQVSHLVALLSRISAARFVVHPIFSWTQHKRGFMTAISSGKNKQAEAISSLVEDTFLLPMADSFEIIREDDQTSLGMYKVTSEGKPVSEVLEVIFKKYGLDGILLEGESTHLTGSDRLAAGKTYKFQSSTNVPPPEVGPSSKKRKRSPAVPTLDSETEVAERIGQRSKYIKDLLTPPDKLPIEVRDLHEFLSEILRPLPVSLARVVSVDDEALVRLSSQEDLSLSEVVNVACNAFRERPNNEADSSHKLRSVTGDFLLELDSLASSEQQLLSLWTTMDSNTNPGTVSTATALVRLKRPDFALYIRNALILRWENKIDPAGFETALQENIEKLAAWSYLYYGTLPYVIGGRCSGSLFQWLRLSKKGTCIVAEPISAVYNLWTVKGVVKVLHSVVQMHRLLQKLQEHLPVAVPVTLYKDIERPNGSVLVGPEFVLKTIEGLEQEKVDFLQSLYEAIAGSNYLIQLKGKIMHTRKSTKLALHPVGNASAKPQDLKQLRNATHDMLCGLVDLHKAQFTHRDIRWDNCILDYFQGEAKWILIDLECAGRDGDIWEGERLVTWDDSTLNRHGQYTTSSDMYQLGKLIVDWVNESGEDSGEAKYIRGLGEKMQNRREAAAKMLKRVCRNPCARCKLFTA